MARSAGREPDWHTVYARFSAAPYNLQNSLARWFGREFTDREVDWDERRRQVLAVAVDDVTRSVAAIRERLTSLAAAAREQAIQNVRHRFSDKEDRYLQRVLASVVDGYEWPVEGHTETDEGAMRQAAAEVSGDVRRLHSARRWLGTLVGRLGDGDAIDKVVGELWALTTSESARNELLEAVGDRIPSAVPAKLVLERFDEPDWRFRRMRWAPSHWAELHELASKASGVTRLLAIRLIVERDGRDEFVAITAHLPSDDEAFEDAAYQRLAALGPAPSVDVAQPERLPLAARASRGVAGWKPELLSRIATASGHELRGLADLAREHEVREAVGLLEQALARAEHAAADVARAIIVLSPKGAPVRRLAAMMVLDRGWVSEGGSTLDEPDCGWLDELARELCATDLGAVFDGSVALADHPRLASAVRQLGSEVVERLLEALPTARKTLAVAARTQEELEWPTYESGQAVSAARKRLTRIGESLLVSSAERDESLGAVVGLVAEALGGDRHHAWSNPGPLGAEFESPGDLDWHSEHETSRLVDLAMEALRVALQRDHSSWQALLRLLEHPSEALRLRVFELCAERAQPAEVAAIGIRALEGHLANNDTRWPGAMSGLIAGTLEAGACTIHVEFPDTQSELLRAVRSRLTRLHQPQVAKLAAHPLGYFRRLAATWAGELGDRTWTPMVEPLLSDDDPGVVAAAVDAVSLLHPGRVDALIRPAASRASWATPHYDVMIRKLLPRREDVWIRQRDPRPELASLLETSTAVTILSRAADLEPTPAEDAWTAFRGSPSRVERVLDAQGELREAVVSELADGWSESDNPHVRCVGHRLRARSGTLHHDDVASLLRGPSPRERMCGAECAVLGGFSEFAGDVHQLLGALLQDGDVSRRDFEVWGVVCPERDTPVGRWTLAGQVELDNSTRSRLIRLLRKADVGFVELLGHLPNPIHFGYDGDQSPESEEAMDVVRGCLERWGPEGGLRILALMDGGKLDEVWGVVDQLRDWCLTRPEFRAEIERRGERGGPASASVVEAVVSWEREHDLAGLMDLLKERVLPSLLRKR